MTGTLWDVSTSYSSSTQNYIDSHLLLQDCFAKQWIQLIRVAPNCFDRKRQVFTRYGLYTPERYEIVDESICADLIWNRSMHNSSLFYIFWSLPIHPAPQFSSLSDDKLQQYTLLKKYQPRTFLLHNFLNTKKVQDSFGAMVVLKPRFWSGWVDVQLFKKQELLDQKHHLVNVKKRMLVQQYIDNSWGIPWLVPWRHDLRVVFLWNSIDHISIRQPSDSEEFRSNVAVWWFETIFTADVIPPELKIIIEAIQKSLRVTQEFYSLDFGYNLEEKKWYCFELNASPWIEYTELQREFATAYYTRLAIYFKSLFVI